MRKNIPHSILVHDLLAVEIQIQYNSQFKEWTLNSNGK